jgi:hypothetical protein
MNSYDSFLGLKVIFRDPKVKCRWNKNKRINRKMIKRKGPCYTCHHTKNIYIDYYNGAVYITNKLWQELLTMEGVTL